MDDHSNPPVVIVMLRQPHLDNPSEKRSDPFWEFGSFGCTGCHQSNLLNPRRADELIGSRLAFIQGGPGSMRLLHLTSPVEVVYHSSRCELRWHPMEMPLKFEHAPIVINNFGYSDTPAINEVIAGVNRTTPVGRFTSCFRSRRSPISHELTAQMETAIQSARNAAGAIASSYEQALPYLPPLVDPDRKSTYHSLIASA